MKDFGVFEDYSKMQYLLELEHEIYSFQLLVLYFAKILQYLLEMLLVARY